MITAIAILVVLVLVLLPFIVRIGKEIVRAWRLLLTGKHRGRR